MLDEVVTPGDGLGELGEHGLEGFGDGGVVYGFVVGFVWILEAGEREEQTLSGAAGRLGGANPDAGAGSALADLVGEGGHIGEFGVGEHDIGVCAAAGPAGVDDGEGACAGGGCEGDDEVGVAEDAFGRVFAVGVVPVVGAVDGGLGQTGVGAELVAEGCDGLMRGLSGMRVAGDDGGGGEFAGAELDAVAAV